jgi:hypothetical protein
MGKIALVPYDIKSRGTYLSTQNLPVDYMSDFSLMGFVVERYHDALSMLESAGYRLDRHDNGAEIHFQDYKNLIHIKELFLANNLSCSFSDIADTLYQA